MIELPEQLAIDDDLFAQVEDLTRTVNQLIDYLQTREGL